MFDMLDDDDLGLGYQPSVPTSKSRTGSMKKMTKKEPKAPKPTSKFNYSDMNQFDDLMDDILEKESKNVGFGDNKSTVNNTSKTAKDNFDFFDDPKPKSVEKPSKLVIKDESPPSPTRNRLKMQASDEIITEEPIFKNLSKPSMTTANASKIDKIQEEPIYVSSRNMKPPLKKKDSQTSINPVSNINMSSGLGLTIPEQSPKLTIGSSKQLDKKQQKKEDDDIIRPPPRLMGRRPSADKNKEDESNYSLGLSLAPDPKESKKEEPAKGRGLFLTMDQPKGKKKQEDSPYFSFNKQKQSKPSLSLGKQPLKIEEPRPKIPSQRQLKLEPPKRNDFGLNIDQSVTMKDSAMPQINIRGTNKTEVNSEDFDRQMQMMKNAFQKQIDFLQVNLEKQITINRQTRQKIIQDSNKMIEDQRSRSKKMHEEEIARQKEMFQWQRKRLEQNYQSEIESLKQSLQFANKTTANSNYRPSAGRQEVEYLEMQLKNQKRILEDREKMVDKRQRQIQQRELELTKRRKREDDRIRDEERKLLELQSKLKKQSMDEKRVLSEEKQKMAMQLANLQLQARKRIEKAQLVLKQNKMARQAIQNQKGQLRLANAELVSKYKSRNREIEDEKQRIQLIEHDLIKKLRIVELKTRQVSKEVSAANINKTMVHRKQNNWLDDRSASQLRGMSVEKNNDRSFEQAKAAKDRFYQLSNNTRDKMNVSVRDNKKFNLENYMLTVDQYNKLRSHA